MKRVDMLEPRPGEDSRLFQLLFLQQDGTEDLSENGKDLNGFDRVVFLRNILRMRCVQDRWEGGVHIPSLFGGTTEHVRIPWYFVPGHSLLLAWIPARCPNSMTPIFNFSNLGIDHGKMISSLDCEKRTQAAGARGQSFGHMSINRSIQTGHLFWVVHIFLVCCFPPPSSGLVPRFFLNRYLALIE